MTSTSELINMLTGEAKPSKPLPAPASLSRKLIITLMAYAASVQMYLGFRADLAMQFTRPLFALEMALLAALFVSSALACVVVMYPDAYQKTTFLKIPYILFALFMLLMLFQLMMPQDTRMSLPITTHALECTVCIASVSFIPSGYIFSLLREGATIRPFRAGTFAVLTASSLGCLLLRMAERNDSIAHLITWHYLPIMLFAVLGAWAGKQLLKW